LASGRRTYDRRSEAKQNGWRACYWTFACDFIGSCRIRGASHLGRAVGATMVGRKLYEIWQHDDLSYLPWRAQMRNYVAHFQTKQQAEHYIEMLKKIEEQQRRRT
jgi:hypothetical protein